MWHLSKRIGLIAIAGLWGCGRNEGMLDYRSAASKATVSGYNLIQDLGLKSSAVIAHRGNGFLHPENTLSAYRASAFAKVDAVEMDVRISKDHHLVVMHDSTLDRMTNVEEVFGENRRVEETMLSDLQALRVGKPQQYNDTIPTLLEAVDTVQSASIPLLDHKSGSPEQYADFIHAHGLIDKVIVQSFNWKFLKELHTLVPELMLGGLASGAPDDHTTREVVESGIDIIVWNYRDLSEENVHTLSQAGRPLWTFTMNNVQEYDRLAQLGVSGFITDIPKKLRNIEP